MAQHVQVVLVDDLDGGKASETVSFALDGVAYEIDLSDKNAAKLRDALATWVGHARRAGGRSSARRGRARSASGSRATWRPCASGAARTVSRSATAVESRPSCRRLTARRNSAQFSVRRDPLALGEDRGQRVLVFGAVNHPLEDLLEAQLTQFLGPLELVPGARSGDARCLAGRALSTARSWSSPRCSGSSRAAPFRAAGSWSSGRPRDGASARASCSASDLRVGPQDAGVLPAGDRGVQLHPLAAAGDRVGGQAVGREQVADGVGDLGALGQARRPGPGSRSIDQPVGRADGAARADRPLRARAARARPGWPARSASPGRRRTGRSAARGRRPAYRSPRPAGCAPRTACPAGRSSRRTAPTRRRWASACGSPAARAGAAASPARSGRSSR